MVLAYIGIGSNIEAEKNIASAIRELENEFGNVKKSSLYSSKPWGNPNQGNFLNLAVEIDTSLSPKRIFSILLDIERRLGRIRKEKNSPRTIDLDLLFYGDEASHGKELTIPHKGVMERDFVLMPLIELNPNIIHPINKIKCIEILKGLKERYVIGKTS